MYLGQFCRMQAHTVFLKTRARCDGLQADKTKRSRLMHGLAVFVATVIPTLLRVVWWY
jgi:hypothetical protein